MPIEEDVERKPQLEALDNRYDGHAPEMAQGRFCAGIDDVIIFPLVLIALAAKILFRATLSILIHILDYAFPILLQLARFPLFTGRIIGDGVAALLKGVVGYLPVSLTKRAEWREFVSRRWSWLRQKISYKAFEEAVHHVFERGMAWVFRKCRTLTPRGALLVIFGAVLWLPISFGIATAMHAILIAKAMSLPPWMQLLHPLATIIAKSKLLVLPAYPAAWPQAKKHSFVLAILRFWQYLASLHVMMKARYRFHQMEREVAKTTSTLGRAAAHARHSLSNTQLKQASRAAMARTAEILSKFPLAGSIVRSYATHYDGVEQQHTERLSEKVSGFFARWSIKFSAEYYEAKERDETAGHPIARRQSDQTSAIRGPHTNV